MMTIRQIYDQYIYSRSTYCSKETIEKYSDDLRLFFRFLERNYMISVEAAGFDALDQESIYQDYLVCLSPYKHIYKSVFYNDHQSLYSHTQVP